MHIVIKDRGMGWERQQQQQQQQQQQTSPSRYDNYNSMGNRDVTYIDDRMRDHVYRDRDRYYDTGEGQQQQHQN